MKSILQIVLAVAPLVATGQIISVKKAFNNAVVNKTNNTINNGVNQGVNEIFSAPGKIFRKVKDKDQQNTNTNTNSAPPVQQTNQQDTYSGGAVTKTESSDFVAGTEVLLSDNFSRTKVGDFPANWLTNSSGEVRTINGHPGQWLQFSLNGIFALPSMGDLPDNFTMEFDAIFHNTPSKDVHYIMYLYSIKDKVADFKETNYPGNAGVFFAFNTANGEIDAENFEGGKAGIIDSHLVTDLLKTQLANKVHVGIMRQKSKVSLYINGTKIFSSPNALPSGYTYNAIKFGSFFMGNDDFMLLTNISVAGF